MTIRRYSLSIVGSIAAFLLLLPSAQVSYAAIADVQTYGASCAPGDDTSAIQNALNSGADVVMFSGGCAFEAIGLNVPSTVREIIFEKGTSLKYGATNGHKLLTISGSPGIRLRGGRFEVPSSSADIGILYITNSSDVVIEDCLLTGSASIAAKIENSGNVTIPNNILSSNAYGIYLTNVDGFNITGNEVRDCALPATTLSIAISLTSTYGLQPESHCKNGTIAGNRVKGHGFEQGIMGHAGENVSIVGNTITGCSHAIAFPAIPAPPTT